MGVSGTDLRSIKDYEPIPALYDMEAVEATGGEASNIGEAGMEEGMGMDPAMHQEMMAMIQQIGPEVVMQMLTAVTSDPQMLQMMTGGGGPPGGPGGAPMAPPDGPVGALSGLQV